jgi:hypothetical protein
VFRRFRAPLHPLMKTKKILVRLDWNINDANKLSVRYNHTKTKDGVQLMVTQQMLVSVTEQWIVYRKIHGIL